MRGRANRLDRLDEAPGSEPDRLDRLDVAAASQDRPGLHERPGTATLDALLRRLADLPPGHPSSTRAERRRGVQTDRPGRDLPPDRADDAPAESFWAEVPRFEALWQSHLRRWPDRRDQAGAADRPEDPQASWRGDGGQYLRPEHNAQADRLITELRRPEKEVTTLLKDIEQNNPHGGVLAGLDRRLKGAGRLKEKIVDKAEGDLGASLANVVSKISDAVRYTFCFGNEEYADGYGHLRQRLESAGYHMIYSKNHWLEDPEYKGVNTRWKTSGGDRFELQVHTRESFYAKEQLTHRSYQRLRAPDTRWEELSELEAYQGIVSSAIPKPAGIEQIPDELEG